MDAGIATARVYTDFNQLQALKLESKHDEKSALKKVAQQFESVFIGMVLKSMRQANQAFKSDLMDSDSMDFCQDMFDQQLAVSLSGQGFGIAEMLEKQLSKNPQEDTLQNNFTMAHLVKPSMPNEAQGKIVASQEKQESGPVIPKISEEKPSEIIKTSFQSPMDFVKHLWGEAKKAANQLGVDANILLAQAALETGWGKKIITNADGQSSFNLFNVKANHTWQGDKVSVKTLENKQGVAVKSQETFKKYQSFKDSFDDYVDLIRNNHRYQNVMHKVGDAKNYLQSLQQAGYATDPKYAEKITDILNSHGFKNILKQFQ